MGSYDFSFPGTTYPHTHSRTSWGSASSRSMRTDNSPSHRWCRGWDHRSPTSVGHVSAQSVSGAPEEAALQGQAEISAKGPEEWLDSRRSQSLQPSQKLQQWYPWALLEVCLSSVQAPVWWKPSSGGRRDSTLILGGSEKECPFLGITTWLVSTLCIDVDFQGSSSHTFFIVSVCFSCFLDTSFSSSKAWHIFCARNSPSKKQIIFVTVTMVMWGNLIRFTVRISNTEISQCTLQIWTQKAQLV